MCGLTKCEGIRYNTPLQDGEHGVIYLYVCCVLFVSFKPWNQHFINHSRIGHLPRTDSQTIIIDSIYVDVERVV